MRRKNLGSSIVKKIITIAMALMMITSTMKDTTISVSASELENVAIEEVTEEVSEETSVTVADVIAAINEAEKAEASVVKKVWVGDAVAEEIIAIYDEQKAKQDVVNAGLIEENAEKKTDKALEEINSKIEEAEGNLTEAKDFVEPEPEDAEPAEEGSDETEENVEESGNDVEESGEVNVEVVVTETVSESMLDKSEEELEDAISHAEEALETINTSAAAQEEYDALEKAYNTANAEYEQAAGNLSEAYQNLVEAQVEYEKAKEISDDAMEAALAQLEKAEAEMDKAVAATKLAKDRVDKTYDVLTKVSDKLDELKDNTGEALQDAVAKLEESVANTDKAIENLGEAFDEAKAPVEEFRKAAEKLQAAIEALAGPEGAIKDAVDAQLKLDGLYREYKAALDAYNKALGIIGEYDPEYGDSVKNGDAAKLVAELEEAMDNAEAAMEKAETAVEEYKKTEARLYSQSLIAAKRDLNDAINAEESEEKEAGIKAAEENLAELIIKNEVAGTVVSLDADGNEISAKYPGCKVVKVSANEESDYGTSDQTFFVVVDENDEVKATYMYSLNEGSVEIYEADAKLENKVTDGDNTYVVDADNWAVDEDGNKLFEVKKDENNNYYKVVTTDVEATTGTTYDISSVSVGVITTGNGGFDAYLNLALTGEAVSDLFGGEKVTVKNLGSDQKGSFFTVYSSGVGVGVEGNIKNINYTIYVNIDESTGNVSIGNVEVTYEECTQFAIPFVRPAKWEQRNAVFTNTSATHVVKSAYEAKTTTTATIDGKEAIITVENGVSVATFEDGTKVTLRKDENNGYHIDENVDVDFHEAARKDTVYSISQTSTDKNDESFEKLIEYVKENFGEKEAEYIIAQARYIAAQGKLDAYEAYFKAEDDLEAVDLGSLAYLPKHVWELGNVVDIDLSGLKNLDEVAANLGTIIKGSGDSNIDYTKITDPVYLTLHLLQIIDDLEARGEALEGLSSIVKVNVDPIEFVAAYLYGSNNLVITGIAGAVDAAVIEGNAEIVGLKAAIEATKINIFITKEERDRRIADYQKKIADKEAEIAKLKSVKEKLTSSTEAKHEYAMAWIDAITTKIDVAKATVVVGQEAFNTGKAGFEVMKAAAKINDAAVKVALAKAQEDLMYGTVTALVIASDTLDLADAMVNAIINQVSSIKNRTDVAYEKACAAREALEALKNSLEPVNADELEAAEAALEEAWADYEALAGQLGTYRDADGNVLTDENGKPVTPTLTYDENGNFTVDTVTVGDVEYTVDNGLYKDLEDAKDLLGRLQSEYDELKAAEDAANVPTPQPVTPPYTNDETPSEAGNTPVVTLVVNPATPANAGNPNTPAVTVNAPAEETEETVEVSEPVAEVTEEVTIAPEETPLASEPEEVTIPEAPAPLAPAPEAAKKHVWWWWILLVVAAVTGTGAYTAKKRKEAKAAKVEANK